MPKTAEEKIQEAILNGWDENDARDGYAIFTNPQVGNGAEHIERIDELDMFDSDFDAAKKAEEDGIPIIHDWTFPETHNAAYLDTYENRKILFDFFESMKLTLSNAEVKALIKYIPVMAEFAKSFDKDADANELVSALFSLKEKLNWDIPNDENVKIYINEQVLDEYIKDEKILEFENPEKCLEYFNTYDFQEFRTVKEMKSFQGKYGFEHNGKWYHINVDEALDVYRIYCEKKDEFVMANEIQLSFDFPYHIEVWDKESALNTVTHMCEDCPQKDNCTKKMKEQCSLLKKRISDVYNINV